MDIVLKHNIFEFHDGQWKQEIGAVMGSRPVPPYANMLMAKMDHLIKETAKKYMTDESEGLKVLKRFLDDYFLLFIGTTKNLHILFEEINKLNPTIQFTMSHTSVYNEAEKDQCGCDKKSEIPFLDTMISIKEGYLDTDLYKKETDRNQFLLPSSCHVKQTTTSIPYSLSLRIVRICRDPKNREKQFQNLKWQLLEWDYPEKIIDSAILKARKVPRKFALHTISTSSVKEILKSMIDLVFWDQV